MKKTLPFVIGACVLLPLCVAPASAKKTEGGYYYSLTHPDLGTDAGSRYRDGEGYYGSLSGAQVEDPTHGYKEGEGYYGSMAMTKLQDPTHNYKDGEGYYAFIVQPLKATQEEQSVGQLAEVAAAEAASFIPPAMKRSMETSAHLDPLGQVEQDLFHESYTSDARADRLNRIERFVFGSSKSGDEESRLAAVQAALQPAHQESEPIFATVKPSTNSFDAGISMFKQNAFHAAEESFEQAVAQQSMSQKAHYWLAMSRLRLYDYEGARDEFQLAFRLDPFGEMGQQAKLQLLDVASTIEKLNRDPVDPDYIVQQTLRTMRRQTRSLQAQKIAEGNQTANWRQRLTGISIAKMQQDTQNYLHDSRMNARYNGYTVAPGEMQEVSNMTYIRTNYLRTDGQVQSNHARQDGYERAGNVQDSFNGALTLFGERPRPGEPRLRYFGSNLYVHYYGKESADGPPTVAPDDPPIRAVALPYGKN